MADDQTIDDARFIAICEDLLREGKTSGPVWTSKFYEEAAIWERFLRDTLLLWGEIPPPHRIMLTSSIRNHYRKKRERKEAQ